MNELWHMLALMMRTMKIMAAHTLVTHIYKQQISSATAICCRYFSAPEPALLQQALDPRLMKAMATHGLDAGGAGRGADSVSANKPRDNRHPLIASMTASEGAGATAKALVQLRRRCCSCKGAAATAKAHGREKRQACGVDCWFYWSK